ncbi:hypothetical protein ACJJTC_006158 [Scirpophaga incertulas]
MQCWKIVTVRVLLAVVLVLGWKGVQCDEDVDECALGLVSCGPGDCLNLDGSYKCKCSDGFCGAECAVRDPCFEPELDAEGGGAGDGMGAGAGAAEGEGGGGERNVTLGPCRHGGVCEQRCTATPAHVCHCAAGWGGQNCTHQEYCNPRTEHLEPPLVERLI